MTPKSDLLLKIWQSFVITVRFCRDVNDMLRDAGALIIRLADITIIVAAIGYVASKSSSSTIATWYLVVKIAAVLCTQREMRKLLALHLPALTYGSSITFKSLPNIFAAILIFIGAVLWYLHVVPQALEALIAMQRGSLY